MTRTWQCLNLPSPITFHVALRKPVDFCTSTSSTVQQTFFRVSEHGVHAAPTKRHLLQANGMKASESYEPKIEKLHGPYLSILVSSYLYLSIYLSVYLSIYLSIDRSIYHFSNWSTHHSSGSRIYLDLSIYLPIYWPFQTKACQDQHPRFSSAEPCTYGPACRRGCSRNASPT